MNRTTAAEALSALTTPTILHEMTGIDGTVVEMATKALEGAKSQMDFAAVAINATVRRGHPLQAEALTRALAVAFPDDRVGKRHGPHYLSLARHGKVKGLEATSIPFSAKAKAAPKAAPVVETAPAPEPEPVKASTVAETAPADDGKLTAEKLSKLSRKQLIAKAVKAKVSAKGTDAEIIERVLAAQ